MHIHRIDIISILVLNKESIVFSILFDEVVLLTEDMIVGINVGINIDILDVFISSKFMVLGLLIQLVQDEVLRQLTITSIAESLSPILRTDSVHRQTHASKDCCDLLRVHTNNSYKEAGLALAVDEDLVDVLILLINLLKVVGRDEFSLRQLEG